MVEMFTTGPARILNLNRGTLPFVLPADVTIFSTDREWTYDVNKSASRSRNSPFDGKEFVGGPVATIVRGEIVWQLKPCYSGMLPCFLRRHGVDLGLQHPQRADHVLARLARLDDIVDEPCSAATNGLAKRSLNSSIFSRRVVSGSPRLHLSPVDDIHRSFRSHHRDLRRRPREVHIGAQVLRAHHAVRAAIGLARDHGDLRNRRLGVGIQQFRAMPDDAAPLLRRSLAGIPARLRTSGSEC